MLREIMDRSQLDEEKTHIGILEDGKTLAYAHNRRADGSYNQIQFALNEQGYGEFKVVVHTPNQPETMRDPSVQEIGEIIFVAIHALPEEEMTINLCAYIEGLGNHMASMAGENRRILSFSQSVKRSLESGEK